MSGIVACIISNIIGIISHVVSGGGGALIGGGCSSIIDFFINGLGLNALFSALSGLCGTVVGGGGGGLCGTIVGGAGGGVCSSIVDFILRFIESLPNII